MSAAARLADRPRTAPVRAAAETRLLTVDETAIVLNLKPATIRAWLAARKLASVRLGRAIRVPFSEIERMIEKGTTPAREERRG